MSLRPVVGPAGELALARRQVEHCTEMLAHWESVRDRYWDDPDFAMELVGNALIRGNTDFDIGTIGSRADEYAHRLKDAHRHLARVTQTIKVEQRRRWLVPRCIRPRRDGRVRSRRTRTARCARAPARPGDDDPEPEPDVTALRFRTELVATARMFVDALLVESRDWDKLDLELAVRDLRAFFASQWGWP